RSAAMSGFRSCATASVKYPERDWAESELKMPEPADDILRRLARQAQQPAAGLPAYDIVGCARSAVAILKNQTINDRSVVFPLLENMTRKFTDATPNANST